MTAPRMRSLNRSFIGSPPSRERGRPRVHHAGRAVRNATMSQVQRVLAGRSTAKQLVDAMQQAFQATKAKGQGARTWAAGSRTARAADAAAARARHNT